MPDWSLSPFHSSPRPCVRSREPHTQPRQMQKSQNMFEIPLSLAQTQCNAYIHSFWTNLQTAGCELTAGSLACLGAGFCFISANQKGWVQRLCGGRNRLDWICAGGLAALIPNRNLWRVKARAPGKDCEWPLMFCSQLEAKGSRARTSPRNC